MKLKLRWARFFTLAGLSWNLSPAPSYDFQLSLPCRHLECRRPHSILVRVVDKCRTQLAQHYKSKFGEFGMRGPGSFPAFFGEGPENTFWLEKRGAFYHSENLENFAGQDASELWERAAHD